MANLTPSSPVRADHRFIMKVASITFGGKVEYRPGEFDDVARVFSELGGSWQRLFHGSPTDINRLKQIMKVAFQHGYLSKKEAWI